MHLRLFLFGLLSASFVLFACRPETNTATEAENTYTLDSLLSREQLADKVLGLLVGSAIGDAMGAPTEMWDRLSIRIQYGHVDTLDPLTREPSPEGPWAYNLPAGGTTDDTRWKALVADFLIESAAEADTLDARAFSRYLTDNYLRYIDSLRTTEAFAPEPFEQEARRMTWLQEWALVARPYAEGDYEAYLRALNRFYGGDMACAGLLYAPMIGLYYAGVPELAYREAYRLGIFDHGYARDITALAAAMTAVAADPAADPEACLAVVRDIDPYRFFASRLLGRSAYRIYRESRAIAWEAQHYTPAPNALNAADLPARWEGSAADYLRRERAYALLDPKLQDAPFHAGEIWLITLTGMQYQDWEFLPSLAFIVNYGRDNDTSGALAGAILGAWHGASQLPPELVATVLRTNRDRLGIDLERIAAGLTDAIWRRGGKMP